MNGVTRNIRFLLLGIMAGMFLVLPVKAQEVRNAVERHRDRQEIRGDKATIADDVADLDRLSDLILEWSELRASGGDEARIDRVMRQITVELRGDVAETSIEAQKARSETKQSTRELRSDRREVRRDRRDVREARLAEKPVDVAREKHELRDDRRDRRDDRRDRRDDARDEKMAEEILQGKRAIAGELMDLQRQIDGAPTVSEELRNRQAALLDKYSALSRKEIESGIRELREDRRELREDRRETREDRRQRSH